MEDWKTTLAACREKDEVNVVQPKFRELLNRLCKGVVVTSGSKIEKGIVDVCINGGARGVRDASTIRSLGEVKTPPEAGSRSDDGLPNFSDEDQAQTILYCVRLLKNQPVRSFVHAFLSDLEVVIIFRVIVDPCELTGYRVQRTLPKAFDDGGAAALVSMVKLDEASSGLKIPKIDGYKIGRTLGAGATSVVFTAEKGNSKYAFKHVTPSFIGNISSSLFFPDFRIPHFILITACLTTELAFLKAVKHDSIPKLEASNTTGFVMSPLLQPLKEPTRVHVQQLFAALDYIHGQGFVARDIRPDNIMMSLDGKRAYLTDFGFSVKKGAMQKYSGTIKTASDRVLKLLQKNQDNPFEVTPADDMESLGKVCVSLFLSSFLSLLITHPSLHFVDFVPAGQEPKSDFQQRL